MSYEFPIERSKIREFATATKSENAVHHLPDAVVTPTFLAHARLAWQPPDENTLDQLGFDRVRLLHGEELHEFHGPPPRAGQTLHVTTRIGDRWEKRGRRGGVMRFAQIVSEFRDEEERLLATQTTTVLETGKRTEDEVSR